MKSILDRHQTFLDKCQHTIDLSGKLILQGELSSAVKLLFWVLAVSRMRAEMIQMLYDVIPTTNHTCYLDCLLYCKAHFEAQEMSVREKLDHLGLAIPKDWRNPLGEEASRRG